MPHRYNTGLLLPYHAAGYGALPCKTRAGCSPACKLLHLKFVLPHGALAPSGIELVGPDDLP